MSTPHRAKCRFSCWPVNAALITARPADRMAANRGRAIRQAVPMIETTPQADAQPPKLLAPVLPKPPREAALARVIGALPAVAAGRANWF